MKELIVVAKELNALLGFNPPMPTKGITEAELTELVVEAAEEIEVGDVVTKETIKFLKKLKAWNPKPAGTVTGEDDAEGEEDDDQDDAVEDDDDDDDDVPEPEPVAKPKTKAKPAPVVEDDDDDDDDVPVAKPAPAAKAPAKAKPAPVEAEDDDDDVEVEAEDDDEDLIETVQSIGKLPAAEKATALKKLVNGNEALSKFRKIVTAKFDAAELKSQILEYLVKAENKAGSKGPKGALVSSEKPIGKGKSIPAPKAPKAEKVVKEKKTKAPKAEPYGRVDCVCDALKTEPGTIAEWIEKADELIEAKGGKGNANEAKFVIRYMLKMEKHFDFGVAMPTE